MKSNTGKKYNTLVLLISFIVLTIFVVLGKIDVFDEFVFNKLIILKGNFLTSILKFITNLGDTVGTIIVLTISFIIFYSFKKIDQFKFVFCNVLISISSMLLIKNIIRRIRPTWKWISQDGFSYPSGHTISAIALYGTLFLIVYKKVNNKFRIPLLVILSLLMILIPVSRVYFGVHYFSDVLAGIILGFIILITTNNIMDKEEKEEVND